MVAMCEISNLDSDKEYNRDPRSVARRCENYVRSLNFGDMVYIGLEAEFFIFDDVRYRTKRYNTGFRLDSNELPSNIRNMRWETLAIVRA